MNLWSSHVTVLLKECSTELNIRTNRNANDAKSLVAVQSERTKGLNFLSSLACSMPQRSISNSKVKLAIKIRGKM